MRRGRKVDGAAQLSKGLSREVLTTSSRFNRQDRSNFSSLKCRLQSIATSYRNHKSLASNDIAAGKARCRSVAAQAFRPKR